MPTLHAVLNRAAPAPMGISLSLEHAYSRLTSNRTMSGRRVLKTLRPLFLAQDIMR